VRQSCTESFIPSIGEGLAVLGEFPEHDENDGNQRHLRNGLRRDVQTESNANQCPECDGHVTTNTVETVCEDCGLVIDEQRIDHGPEWRAYDDEECERTGAPLTAARHDRGLSTEIGRGTDAKGETNSQGRSGSGWHECAVNRPVDDSSRKLSETSHTAGGEVRRIASVLELSGSVRDQACQLFRSAQTEDLLRGRSIEAIAAASIYGVCRCNGHSRLLDDVVDAARVEQSRVTNAYKTLNTELGLPTQPVRPSEFIPRLASELGISDAIRRRAVVLSKHHRETAISNGCRPSGVAAPAFTKLHRNTEGHSQQRVADAAGMSAVTVRARRDELNAV